MHGLRLETWRYALLMLIPQYFIKYAMQNAADLLTPAAQWIIVVPPEMYSCDAEKKTLVTR